MKKEKPKDPFKLRRGKGLPPNKTHKLRNRKNRQEVRQELRRYCG